MNPAVAQPLRHSRWRGYRQTRAGLGARLLEQSKGLWLNGKWTPSQVTGQCDKNGAESAPGFDKAPRRQENEYLLHGLFGLFHVQVNEDISWFGTLAGADDATILQFIHDAGRATVTQA